MRFTVFTTILAAGFALLPPSLASAQDIEARGRLHGVTPPPEYYEIRARDPNAYDFRYAWKRQAREVKTRRRDLSRGREFEALNRHMLVTGPSRSIAASAGTAVTGTFRIPVLIGYFADRTHSLLPSTGSLEQRLFGPAGSSYTVASYYDEVTNGLVEIVGDVIGWFPVDSAAAWYEGTASGLSPVASHTGDFILELLEAADPSVDFSDYDEDGDGRIDVLAVLHPLVDGACGSGHIWAHRWVLPAWGVDWLGDGVTAHDYIIQSAVGGPNVCDPGQPMPIGVFAHELGHGIADLPDLYGSGSTNGIGNWGLMGFGTYSSAFSPAHPSAWSKQEVGWVAVDTVSVDGGGGQRVLNPVISSDTVLRVELPGTREYFLLENRQHIGSDAYLPGEGLLIWHVDQDLIDQSPFFFNRGLPAGLSLEQSDGRDDLRFLQNRGDPGDPYPGEPFHNRSFTMVSQPSSILNDSSMSTLMIDNITPGPGGSVSFRVWPNAVYEVVTTSAGEGTRVLVDGEFTDAPHETFWTFPGSRTVGIEVLQGNELSRHTFLSWSDGLGREHAVSVDAVPDTLVAMVATEHRLRVSASPHGRAEADRALDADSTAWVGAGDTVILRAIPDDGYVFLQWTGDAPSTSDSLLVQMTRPVWAHADFGLEPTILTAELAPGVVGAVYADTLEASGGTGTFDWSIAGGELPPGVFLQPGGVLGGVPERRGSYPLTFRAGSGAAVHDRSLTLVVGEPILSVQAVMDDLLGASSALSDAELRFLDLIGNRNGRLDVGDARALLERGGE